jgi:hypothetical protein
MSRQTPIADILPLQRVTMLSVTAMSWDNCETKTQLLVAYQSASEAHAKSVFELTKSIGKINCIEHEKLSLATERARLAAGQARNELDAHMSEHRCNHPPCSKILATLVL